jgi:hypothetical protein
MNKKQLNDTVFEALFRQAFIDEFEEEINSIQSEGTAFMCEPSPEFQMRMKKLFEDDNRRTLIKKLIVYTKKIAVILFIILGCTFATLLLNKEVQATVNKVIIEIYEKFNSIILQGKKSDFEEKDWFINYILQDYTIKKHERLGNLTNIICENSQGNKIRFSYIPEKNSTNISIDNENHKMEKGKILNEDAYFLTAKTNKFDNGVIWNKDGYVFELWGKNDIDELKKIAESVSKK